MTGKVDPVTQDEDLREPEPKDPEERRSAYNGVTVDCQHKWDADPCCGCGHRHGHGPWEPRSWEWEYITR